MVRRLGAGAPGAGAGGGVPERLPGYGLLPGGDDRLSGRHPQLSPNRGHLSTLARRPCGHQPPLLRQILRRGWRAGRSDQQHRPRPDHGSPGGLQFPALLPGRQGEHHPGRGGAGRLRRRLLYRRESVGRARLYQPGPRRLERLHGLSGRLGPAGRPRLVGAHLEHDAADRLCAVRLSGPLRGLGGGAALPHPGRDPAEGPAGGQGLHRRPDRKGLVRGQGPLDGPPGHSLLAARHEGLFLGAQRLCRRDGPGLSGFLPGAPLPDGVRPAAQQAGLEAQPVRQAPLRRQAGGGGPLDPAGSGGPAGLPHLVRVEAAAGGALSLRRPVGAAPAAVVLGLRRTVRPFVPGPVRRSRPSVAGRPLCAPLRSALQQNTLAARPVRLPIERVGPAVADPPGGRALPAPAAAVPGPDGGGGGRCGGAGHSGPRHGIPLLLEPHGRLLAGQHPGRPAGGAAAPSPPGLAAGPDLGPPAGPLPPHRAARRPPDRCGAGAPGAARGLRPLRRSGGPQRGPGGPALRCGRADEERADEGGAHRQRLPRPQDPPHLGGELRRAAGGGGGPAPPCEGLHPHPQREGQAAPGHGPGRL